MSLRLPEVGSEIGSSWSLRPTGLTERLLCLGVALSFLTPAGYAFESDSSSADGRAAASKKAEPGRTAADTGADRKPSGTSSRNQGETDEKQVSKNAAKSQTSKGKKAAKEDVAEEKTDKDKKASKDSPDQVAKDAAKDAANGQPSKDSKANKDRPAESVAKAKADPKKDPEVIYGIKMGTGLDATTEKLLNKGDWKAAAARLAGNASEKGPATREHAWLAFAYLYLDRCDDLSKLSKRVAGDGEMPFQLLIRALDESCQTKYEQAEKRLLSLPPVFGNDTLANFALAMVEAKQGQAQSAVAYCQRTVELAPEFAWGYRTLGYLQQRWLDDPVKAEASYARALQLEPNLAEVSDALIDMKLARNDFDGATDTALSAIKANAKEANNYYRLSQIYTQQWRLREALAQLEKAVSLDPANARFYRSRAAIKSFQNKLADAILDQQKAVSLSKDKSFELVELSAMNMLAGNTNKAADNLKEALKIDPDNQAAHDKLYKLLLQEKRYSDLVEECKVAVEHKPKDFKLRLELAQALTYNNDLSAAAEQLVNASNLAPNDAEPHRRLGALRLREKDYSNAAKEYTKALNLNPSSVPDLVALGYCYARNDDFMQAEAAFVTALALQQLSPDKQASSPSRIDIMRSLASLLVEEGRYGDAAQQLEAIQASTRSGGSATLDAFKTAQAKALRDLSRSTAQSAVDTYNQLHEQDKPQHLTSLVDTLIKSERFDLAAPFIEKHSAGDKEEPTEQSFWLVAQSQLARSRGDLDKAETAASQAIAIADQSAEQKSDALLALAQIQLDRKQLTEAEATAVKASTAYDKAFRGYTLVAAVKLKNSDAKGAISAAKKALELNPYHAPAYLILGDAQVAEDQLKDASASYKKAVELYPGRIDAHKSLLETLKRLSLKDEAKREEEQIAQMEKIRQSESPDKM